MVRRAVGAGNAIGGSCGPGSWLGSVSGRDEAGWTGRWAVLLGRRSGGVVVFVDETTEDAARPDPADGDRFTSGAAAWPVAVLGPASLECDADALRVLAGTRWSAVAENDDLIWPHFGGVATSPRGQIKPSNSAVADIQKRQTNKGVRWDVRYRCCVVRSGVASRPVRCRLVQIIEASSSNAAAQRRRSVRASTPSSL